MGYLHLLCNLIRWHDPAGASQELQPCSALRPRAVCSAARVMITSLGGFLWFQKPNQSNQQPTKTQDVEGFRGAKGRVLHPGAGGAAAHPQHGGAGFLQSLTKALHLASSF